MSSMSPFQLMLGKNALPMDRDNAHQMTESQNDKIDTEKRQEASLRRTAKHQKIWGLKE